MTVLPLFSSGFENSRGAEENPGWKGGPPGGALRPGWNYSLREPALARFLDPSVTLCEGSVWAKVVVLKSISLVPASPLSFL